MRRIIDPSARARSFTARRGGMRDSKALDKRLHKVEQRVAPVREDILTPEDWSIVEEVDENPEVDEDVVGRFFLVRNEGADDTFSAGMTAADGEPMLVGLSTIATSSGDLSLTLATAFASVDANPTSISIAPTGYFYVGDSTIDTTIWRAYDASGAYAYAATLAGSTHSVRAIGTDSASNVYTIEYNSSTFTVSIHKHTYIGAFVSSASLAATVVADAWAMAVSASDVIGVVSLNTGVVALLNTSLAVTSSFSTGLSNINGIAFDIDGNIYISSTTDHKVRKYSSAGVLLLTIGGDGTAVGKLHNPKGLGVLSDGTIIVVDQGNYRIQAFDATGEFVATVGSYGSNPDQMRISHFGDVDSFDNFFFADMTNGVISVAKFSEEGEASSYSMQDDFIGGNASNNTTGELGWATGANGSLAVDTSTAAHPGVVTMSTGGSSGNHRGVSIGPWVPTNIDKMSFYFQLHAPFTSIQWRCGIGDTPSTGVQDTDGVGIRFDDSTEAFIQFVKYVGGVMTRTNTTISCVDGAWYQLTLERLSSTSWQVTLRLMSTGKTAQATITGVSATVAMHANCKVRTTNGTGKSMSFDFWNGDFSGITRI